MVTVLAQHDCSSAYTIGPIQNKYIRKMGDLTWEFNEENIGVLDTDKIMESKFKDMEYTLNSVITDNNDDPYEDVYFALDIAVYVRIVRGRCQIIDYNPERYSYQSMSIIMASVNEFYALMEECNDDFNTKRDSDDLVYVAIINIFPKDAPFLIISVDYN